MGVSNFDLNLLKQASNRAVPPHIVQNWVDINGPDYSVTSFCEENYILLQAYATLRGLAQNSRETQRVGEKLSKVTTFYNSLVMLKKTSGESTFKFQKY